MYTDFSGYGVVNLYVKKVRKICFEQSEAILSRTNEPILFPHKKEHTVYKLQ